jgi:hypothetical protein
MMLEVHVGCGANLCIWYHRGPTKLLHACGCGSSSFTTLSVFLHAVIIIIACCRNSSQVENIITCLNNSERLWSKKSGSACLENVVVDRSQEQINFDSKYKKD